MSQKVATRNLFSFTFHRSLWMSGTIYASMTRPQAGEWIILDMLFPIPLPNIPLPKSS